MSISIVGIKFCAAYVALITCLYFSGILHTASGGLVGFFVTLPGVMFATAFGLQWFSLVQTFWMTLVILYGLGALIEAARRRLAQVREGNSSSR